MEFHRVASLLGYSLLPVVIMSATAVLLPRGPFVYALAAVSVLWATMTASALLCASHQALDGQRLLIAYPCLLAYSMFAILTLY